MEQCGCLTTISPNVGNKELLFGQINGPPCFLEVWKCRLSLLGPCALIVESGRQHTKCGHLGVVLQPALRSMDSSQYIAERGNGHD